MLDLKDDMFWDSGKAVEGNLFNSGEVLPLMMTCKIEFVN